MNLIFAFFFLFLIFSLGLNLGLHGIISFDGWHQTSGKDHSRGIYQKHDISNSSRVELPQELPQEYHNKDAAVEPENLSGLERKPITEEEEEVHVLEASADPILYDSSILDAITSHKYRVPLPLKEVIISAEKRYKTSQPGPIETYLQSGGRFPIALLTCNRPKNLEQTIDSLLAVRGLEKTDVIILQDGNIEAVTEVGKRYGLTVIHNIRQSRLRGNVLNGAARIAQHYKFSLSAVFKARPAAPACIVVEDDLLFSPDFLDYFKSTAPLIERDPTVFIASAWNDNGFDGRVKDVNSLRRTDFFPGLGWLLSRQLYIKELEPLWPSEHWDHWLRSSAISKGREIIYPQVPRSFHNGIVGTFMNMDTHNRYFRDIAYNRDNHVVWNKMAYLQGVEDVYEQRLQLLINSCIHVRSMKVLSSTTGAGKVHCIWISVDPEPAPNGLSEFQPIGRFFGIWHEHKRGSHKGVHEFYWKDRYVVLLNVFESANTRGNYRNLMPSHAEIVKGNEFVLL